VYTNLVAALQPTVVVERPPVGPARGKWEASPWMFVLFASVVVIGAVTVWLWRLRRSPKARD